MNPCKDCAKWKQTEGTTAPTPSGMCARYLPGGFYTLTWADAQCPAFEARKDWAEKVIERIGDEKFCWDTAKYAEWVRDAAKAHYEYKP